MLFSGYNVNLRENPGLNQTILEVLNNGQGVEILDASENVTKEKISNQKEPRFIRWFKVKSETGKVGFISTEYVKLLLGHQKQNGLIGIAGKLEKGKLNATVLSVLRDGVVSEPDNYDFSRLNRIILVPKKVPIDHGTVISSNQKVIGGIENVKFAADYTKPQESDCSGEYYFSGTFKGKNPDSKGLVILGLNNISEILIEVKDFSDRAKIKILENLTSIAIKKLKPEEFKGNNFVCTSGDKCLYKSIKFSDNEYIVATQTVAFPDKSGYFHVFRIDQIFPDKIESLHYHGYMDGKRDVPNKETLLAVTDLDNNGILEITTFISGYEWWFYGIYSLEKNRAISIFRGIRRGMLGAILKLKRLFKTSLILAAFFLIFHTMIWTFVRICGWKLGF